MNLIVGATGMLGGEICRLLAEQGKAVRGLVRETSNPEKVTRLRGLGAEVVCGDLKDRASLEAACRGATALVSTASSTLSRQEGDSIESVDRQGQLNLVEAAEQAGVKHFVLISFPKVDISFPLQSAKRTVEDRLRRGRMAFTILQPTFFTEVWLSPALGFDPAHATAQIYGGGHNKISWISFQDVAKFAVAALDQPRTENAVIKLGGPDALSPLEVVRLAEQALGKTVVVQHVPEEALRAQHDAATDSLQQSFAALMLYYASGETIDMTETLRALPVRHLKSVSEYLRATV
ncbi:MAG: NAD(P)-dependent oxidoreductase [Acidobacteria bacterium]|nr:MAG: NAD(P)-dependent oxidoreductase [Acidobacteriota bacterium]